jgi:hypothetical protein
MDRSTPNFSHTARLGISILQSKYAFTVALGYVDMLNDSDYIERTVSRTEVSDVSYKRYQREKKSV